ncbi:ABC transporter permease [Clostridium sp. MSJ-11]|uniref:ABC transporter permease n=1 Tax=Clostridium mobile TaxID=2841512 RepID=A0ABS6EDZ2_9CLOT|nr:ABC transporter permease [Clostridium mobile]MBU5483424.1 ABC transporter permease [Clostridium mobile]
MYNTINSDKLKLKGMSLFWISISLPLMIFVYESLNFFFRVEYIEKMTEMFNANSLWDYLIFDNSLLLGLGVPLSITIIASALCNIEHQSNCWKQILSLPIPKTNIYLGKLSWLMISLFISSIALTIGMLLIGFIFNFKGNIPWKSLLGDSILVYITSFPIITLQLWLSMTIKNQAFPIAAGAISSMMGLFFAMNKNLRWLFWAYPTQASTIMLGEKGLTHNPDLRIFIIGSLVIGCIFLITGTLHFKHKDM